MGVQLKDNTTLLVNLESLWPNKCLLTVVWEIVMEDGLIMLLIPLRPKVVVVWKMIIHTLPIMDMAARLTNVLNNTQLLDIIPTMSRILELKNSLNPSTTMDPTLFMFMPTATSNVITVESLMILAAHKALITMLLSMLVMTNLKDTGPSEIPGLVDGEKMVTSE